MDDGSRVLTGNSRFIYLKSDDQASKFIRSFIILSVIQSPKLTQRRKFWYDEIVLFFRLDPTTAVIIEDDSSSLSEEPLQGEHDS